MSRGKIVTRHASLTGIAAMLVAAAPPPVFAAEAPEPFSANRDRASFDRALKCLTEAIYYEARSESDDGQRAVAQVVLNRVRHPSYPNSVCGVVYQGSQRSTGCQFTFTCDGSIGGYIDETAWARAQRIAGAALRGSVYRPVGLALNYHTTAIRPYWAPSLVRQAVIGAHIFYRRPGSDSDDFDQAPSAVEPRIGYASAAPVDRASRTQAVRASREYQPARVERAVIERPRIERPTIERPRIERAVFAPPTSSRVTAARRTSTASAPAPAATQAKPAPGRGPRTTIEGGVRVARGS